MKIEHINKLILKFIGGGIVNFPTRFLKWIKVESCGCNGEDGDNDDSGGDSSNCMTIEDFADFNISVAYNDYVNNYESEQIVPIEELLNVSSLKVLNALLSLGANNQTYYNNTIYLYDEQNTESGSYSHSIALIPNGQNSESGVNININTTYFENETSVYENYYVDLLLKDDNTLEIINIGYSGGE